jgi:hypothetical protein
MQKKKIRSFPQPNVQDLCHLPAPKTSLCPPALAMGTKLISHVHAPPLGAPHAPAVCATHRRLDGS